MASYLGYPRIHFAGQYRADASTTNNDFCNYRMSEPLNPDQNMDFNKYGTNEFEIVNAKVTSVHYKNGTTSLRDSVVGHVIIGNSNSPHAKLSSPYNQFSSLYGMSFGIQWHNTNVTAFRGQWTPNVIAQSQWSRLKCYTKAHHGLYPWQITTPLSSQFTTTVTNIDWQSMGGSEVLTQLQNAVGKGSLTLRGTMFYYTRNYLPYVTHNATYGYLIGVIGATGPADTLNVPGERAMYTKDEPIGLKFDRDDLCYGVDLSQFVPWTYIAVFEVDKKRSEVRIDLSNSLPTDMSNSLRDIGKLRLGILKKSCVYLLGDDSGLPYAAMEDFSITSGIYTVPVHPFLMHTVFTHPLVLAQVLDNEQGTIASCSERLSTPDIKQSIQILLQEVPYFIRPTGYYKHYLDRQSNPEEKETVYVTKYGEPAQGLKIRVHRAYSDGVPDVVLLNYHAQEGVIPSSWSATTNEKGLATFTFRINPNVMIPKERHYFNDMCNFTASSNTAILPVENHEYLYNYCMEMDDHVCGYTPSYFLASADESFTRPYTWVKDVGPIFTLYARIAPAMKKVLDLSSFKVVTSPKYLDLLNFTLRLDFYDPSYMPTTRDLSPAKRKMILEWLEDPKYDLWDQQPAKIAPFSLKDELLYHPLVKSQAMSYFLPPRCRASALLFQDDPHEHDVFFEEILSPSSYYGAEEENLLVRPLGSETCTLQGLMKQLQMAIELEWATIPVYITSLYSVVEGYNTEIYNLINTVIVQEMLHMVQVANILIALNGSPLIDSPSVVPSYPVVGLPGGVLPGLKVSIEKLSLEHVYKVFMPIETPQRSFVTYPAIVNEKNTIGAFYGEITDCIEHLNDEVFNVTTVDYQVKWPLVTDKSVGYVTPVTNKASALKAIDIIISQGEGSGLLDPNELGSETLAHFYKFEEIVCGKHLVKVSDFHYAYTGSPISFDAKGVWPMRPNPTAATVHPHTNCYIESRAFHGVYRMLLRRLQEVFNGHPQDMMITMQLMESLKIHAKKLMWTRYGADLHDNTTCGPVWDYTWPQG